MLLLFSLLLSFNFVNLYPLDREIEVLTSNFFDNLEVNPSLAFDTNPKKFIEKQITTYMNTVTRNEPVHNKKRRSLLDDFVQDIKGVHLLSGVDSFGKIPARFPTDISLFQQNSTWFAAALTSEGVKDTSSALVVFQYTNDSFVEISGARVVNAKKLASLGTPDFTLIAVAEYDSPKTDFHDKSGIYQFDGISGIVKIQSIDMHYASDIAMWRIHNEVYMSTAQFMSNKSGNINYELESPVYKWMGKHFDLVQSIPSSGVKKITPFTIDNSHFLALANFQNDLKQTRIYSEIFKYDYHEEKFRLYQRILTSACTDIRVFHLKENERQQDTFLVVANSFQTDIDGSINSDADSIIYKFVDDYFIPVQTIQLSGVVHWLPVQGPNNEFVLIASTRYDDIRFFQYDGWVFLETPQRSALPTSDVKSIRSVLFNNVTTLVVADKNTNGNIPNLFRLNFTYQNTLNEIYSEMITWCDSSHEKLENLDELFVGNPPRADIDEEVNKNETAEISSRIESLETTLDRFEPTCDVIVIKNTATMQDLVTTTINNIQIDEMLNNVLDISAGFELGEVKFESVEVNDSLSTKTINGHDFNTLLHASDNLSFDNLIVGGILTSPGIRIGGQLNGVTIDVHSILLKHGDQNLSRPLNVHGVAIDKMSAQLLNGQMVSTVNFQEVESVVIDHFHNLSVTNLNIGSYINDVDIPTLNKYALKALGNQTITSTYSFDHLHGGNFEVAGHTSGKKLSDLIGISSGSYSIKQDLVFKNNLFVGDLKILKNINEINVDDDGKMDILLKDNANELEISGEKIFDDVIIHRAIYLQGHINSTNLEKMNPVVTMNELIVLEGSKAIIGQMQVENLVSASDVVTKDGAFSLNKLKNSGLKLDAKKVKPHLQFVQQINVEDIFADTINGREPENFVVTGSEDTQIIMGSKVFVGDLAITGATGANKINNVDVDELENNVLTIDGDQMVVGKHHLKNVKTHRISVNNTMFNNTAVKSIDDLRVTIIDDDLQIAAIEANTISVRGFINGFDFDKIVNDTVQTDVECTVTGHKFFKTLTVDDLHVQTGLEVDQWHETNQISLAGPVVVKNSFKVGNLYFEENFNGIARSDFAESQTEADGSTTVDGNFTFDSLVVFGDVYIASNQINNVNITDLVQNSVKVDEPFNFDRVTFDSAVVSKKPVLLTGQIENFDFDNAVLSNSGLNIEIFNEKTFSNVTVNGSVGFAFVNDLNLTQFCQFAMGEIGHKNVTISGNAFFVKGPDVAHINGVSVKKIAQDAWFGNQDCELSGSFSFGDVIFNEEVTVLGFVDNVSLSLLYENYFSKTKDQNITAVFTFDNIIFNNVSVPEIAIRGDVNDINLDEFVRTALLRDYDQMFETVVFFENCTVTNLTGDFKVNGLNLDKDIMRYDKVNLVTGSKTFQNLNIDHLKLDKNVKIQNVDVLDWFKNIVLRTTGYNITGTKTFTNATFKNGFQLDGRLNGLTFDMENIMVKDVPQNITSVKTLHSGTPKATFFKGIKLKGTLNQIDVSKLISDQAYKNKNNVFKTDISLHNNITADRLVIKKTFKGVNISELVSNITNLGALNNLVDEFEKLLEMSRELQDSLKGQAYHLHRYKLIQTIPVTNSKKFLCPDGVYRIGVMIDSFSKMRLYGWHDDERQFLDDGASIKFTTSDLNYVDQVMMGRYIYTETSDGKGYFTQMIEPAETIDISTNTTFSTTSFVLPDGATCTMFLYYKCVPKIYCVTGNEIKFLQSLESVAHKASAITTNDGMYFITINEPNGGPNSRIVSWRFNKVSSRFEAHQSMFEEHPTSISTASHGGFHYLAIASGHLQDAIFSGSVEIRRFDKFRRAFLPWQSLQLDAPIQVEFAILPSKELLLYVVTDNPTQPLLVFRYEGVAGFKLYVSGSTLPKISYLNQFMGGADRHFIVAQNHDEINIIQAIFKGEKIE